MTVAAADPAAAAAAAQAFRIACAAWPRPTARNPPRWCCSCRSVGRLLGLAGDAPQERRSERPTSRATAAAAASLPCSTAIASVTPPGTAPSAGADPAKTAASGTPANPAAARARNATGAAKPAERAAGAAAAGTPETTAAGPASAARTIAARRAKTAGTTAAGAAASSERTGVAGTAAKTTRAGTAVAGTAAAARAATTALSVVRGLSAQKVRGTGTRAAEAAATRRAPSLEKRGLLPAGAIAADTAAGPPAAAGQTASSAAAAAGRYPTSSAAGDGATTTAAAARTGSAAAAARAATAADAETGEKTATAARAKTVQQHPTRKREAACTADAWGDGAAGRTPFRSAAATAGAGGVFSIHGLGRLIHTAHAVKPSSSSKEGSSSGNEGRSSGHADSSSRDEGSSSRNEGSSSRNEGSSNRNEGSSSRNEGSSSRNEGSSSSKEGSGSGTDSVCLPGRGVTQQQVCVELPSRVHHGTQGFAGGAAVFLKRAEAARQLKPALATAATAPCIQPHQNSVLFALVAAPPLSRQVADATRTAVARTAIDATASFPALGGVAAAGIGATADLLAAAAAAAARVFVQGTAEALPFAGGRDVARPPPACPLTFEGLLPSTRMTETSRGVRQHTAGSAGAASAAASAADERDTPGQRTRQQQSRRFVFVAGACVPSAAAAVLKTTRPPGACAAVAAWLPAAGLRPAGATTAGARDSLPSSQQRRTFAAAAAPSVTVLPSVCLPGSCAALVATLPLLPPAALPAAARRLVKEGVHEPQAWRTLSNRVVAVSQELSISQVAMVLHVYALRQLQDFNVFSQLTARLVYLLRQEDAVGEAGCSSDEASSGEKESGNHFRVLKQVKEPRGTSSSLTARDWTNIVVASGRLLYLDKELHELLAQHLERLLPDMRPKDLVNIAHAYARLRIVDREFFNVVATTLPEYLYDLTPVGLTNIITSFARAGVYDAKLFDAVTAEAARRVQEFGGTELLNLLMGLSKTHTSLPAGLRRRDGPFVATVLKALRRRMGPFGFVQLLQVLEYLILLDYFDPLFIHKKLLPALLARRPSPPTAEAAERHATQGPAAAAATAARAETLLTLYLRLLCCLQQLPALSQTALQLLQEVVEQFPLLFVQEDLGRVAAAIHLLHRLGCYDYNSFSKAEALLLWDRMSTVRQLRFANVVQLQEAFKGFGDDSHWEELLNFFRSLTEETKALLLQERQRGQQLCAASSPPLALNNAEDQPTVLSDVTRASSTVVPNMSGELADIANSAHERLQGSAGSVGRDTKKYAAPLKLQSTADGRNAVESAHRIKLARKQTTLRTSDALERRVSRTPSVHVHQYNADGGYHSSVVTLDKHIRKQRDM